MGCIEPVVTHVQPLMSTVRGPRSPQIGRKAHANIFSTISSDGMEVPGGIEDLISSISSAVVRKRYTAVSVALANKAAALSLVIFDSSTRYVDSALFMCEAARAFISSRFGACRSCRRPICKDAIERTQFKR